MKDKMKNQTSDQTSPGSGAQEKWEANENRLHMTPRMKSFDEGVGKRNKSTPNDK